MVDTYQVVPVPAYEFTVDSYEYAKPFYCSAFGSNMKFGQIYWNILYTGMNVQEISIHLNIAKGYAIIYSPQSAMWEWCLHPRALFYQGFKKAPACYCVSSQEESFY